MSVNRNEDYYYQESKRLRNEVLLLAEALKGNPLKHPEAAFFAYYSRELGARTILCMRRMADGGMYKPYAIISQQMFDAEVGNLQTGALP